MPIVAFTSIGDLNGIRTMMTLVCHFERCKKVIMDCRSALGIIESRSQVCADFVRT